MSENRLVDLLKGSRGTTVFNAWIETDIPQDVIETQLDAWVARGWLSAQNGFYTPTRRAH